MKATQEIDSPAVCPREDSKWQRWLHHPDQFGVRKALFQAHLWLGVIVGAYIFAMSLSGSAIVNRGFLERSGDPRSHLVRTTEWLVDLHENLLWGATGRVINGLGAISLIVLCVTGAVLWWPGITHWQRSLGVNWRSSFARINWDLHNALGVWFLAFVAIWAISGAYFAFPDAFNAALDLFSPKGTPGGEQFGDTALLWLSNLHFGRFGWSTEVFWTLIGLVPAVLAFTGMFMCCHRLLVLKGRPFTR